MSIGREQLVVPREERRGGAPREPARRRRSTRLAERATAPGRRTCSRFAAIAVESRFFFPNGAAILEDPATGSACANLGGWFMATQPGVDVERVVSQGEAVARPSTLYLAVKRRRDPRGRQRDRAGPRHARPLSEDDRLPARIRELAAIEEGRDAGRLPAQRRGTGIDYVVPGAASPARARHRAGGATPARGVDVADLTLVGSSLGGFYATVMAERLGCRAALLNPAVHPHLHFDKYLGPQENLYTGEKFALTHEHVDELRDAGSRARSRGPGATGSSSRPATWCSTIARRWSSTRARCRPSCAAATTRWSRSRSTCRRSSSGRSS